MPLGRLGAVSGCSDRLVDAAHSTVGGTPAVGADPSHLRAWSSLVNRVWSDGASDGDRRSAGGAGLGGVHGPDGRPDGAGLLVSPQTDQRLATLPPVSFLECPLPGKGEWASRREMDAVSVIGVAACPYCEWWHSLLVGLTSFESRRRGGVAAASTGSLWPGRRERATGRRQLWRW